MLQFDLPEFDPYDLTPWIVLMAQMRAPLRTTARLTGESLVTVQQIYHSVSGAPRDDALPDETPLEWFTATANRRYHGAVIASFFGQVREIYPDVVACAAVHCYCHYSRLVAGGDDDGAGSLLDLNGDDTSVLISFTRSIDLLGHLFGINVCHANAPSLTVVKCRSCGSMYVDVADPSAAAASCPLCQRDPILKMLASWR